MGIAIDTPVQILTPDFSVGFHTYRNYFSRNIVNSNKSVVSNSLQTALEKESIHFDLVLSDFNYKFEFDVTDINWDLLSNSIEFFLSLGEGVSIKAILTGYWKETPNKNEPEFEIENFGLGLVKKAETPISNFLTSSLWAMLGLSSKFIVSIPQLNYDFTTSVSLPLDEVSKSLKERQIAYRLMVIESALQTSLSFPRGKINGDDIEAISFCYHAITNRTFDWFSHTSTIPWRADVQSLSWLPSTDIPFKTKFQPEPVVKTIFGTEVNLGLLTAEIENVVIDNYKQAKEDLSKLDNHVVEVHLRSLNGITKIIAINVPHLPRNPWSPKIVQLVATDDQLDKKMLEIYFDFLANSSNEPSNSSRIVLETPTLDEDAFNF